MLDVSHASRQSHRHRPLLSWAALSWAALSRAALSRAALSRAALSWAALWGSLLVGGCPPAPEGALDAGPFFTVDAGLPDAGTPPPGDAGPPPPSALCATEHPWFPIASGSPHCEENAAYAARIPTTAGSTMCTACHANPNDPVATDCATCHQQDAVPTATLHAGIAQLDFESVGDCKMCHADTPVPSLFVAATHNAIACMTDHYSARRCKDCHSSGERSDGIDQRVWPMRPEPLDHGIDFNVPGQDETGTQATCTRCHTDLRPFPFPCP